MTNTVPLNQTAQSIFAADGFTPRMVEQAVIIKQPAYWSSVMPKLIYEFNAQNTGSGAGLSMTKPSNSSFNRMVSIPRIDNTFPACVSKSVSLNATVLLSDPAYFNISAGSTVNDTITNATGLVIGSAEGTLTIQFTDNTNGNTTFSASDFVAGNTISFLGNVDNTISRQSVATQFTVPELDQYVIGRWGGFCELTLESIKLKTYFKNSMGTEFFALQKDYETIGTMNSAMMKYYYGNFAQNTSTATPRSGSWIWQIQNFGGMTEPVSPNETLATFEAKVLDYKRQGTNRSGKVVIVGGGQRILTIQQLLRPYILQAGTTNVVGGAAVKGLGIKEYNCAGLDIVLVQDPFLENKNMWGTDATTGKSTRTNTSLWFDPSPVQSLNGDLPCVMDYYYSVDGLHRQTVPGLIDDKGNLVSTGANGKASCAVNYIMEQTKIITNPGAWMYEGS